MKALFVCTGNTCRSVMAEYLFMDCSSRMKRPDDEAKSCGIAAEACFPVPEGVRKALAQRGIGKVEHAPQPVSRELMDWATDVLAMTATHRDALKKLYPGHDKKIHLFLEKAGLGVRDVEDPIGRSEEHYMECSELIEQGVRGLFKTYDQHAQTAGS